MMKVVGEEGTSLEDYVIYLKSDFVDSVYMQQNSFDPVDAAVSTDRQRYIFDLLHKILSAGLAFAGKDEARSFFYQLRQKFLDWNGSEMTTDAFGTLEKELKTMLEERLTKEREPAVAAETTRE
jgi:V/A-type H+-transporting ATPase subunit A